MSNIADRISAQTVIRWGEAFAPVALFKTAGESKAPKFVKAGPHGRPLERGPVKAGKRLEGGVPTPATAPESAPQSDPLEMTPVRTERDEPTPEPITVGLLEEGYDRELNRDEDVLTGVIIEVDGEDRFVDLTAELARVDEETILDEMAIEGFVRREQVPRMRIKSSYYLGGNGPGAPKVLRLLWEAMRQTGRVAVVRWTKRTAQSTGAIVPGRHSNSLIVLELEWAANVRMPGPRALSHLQAEVTQAEVAAAVELAEAMADHGVLIDEQEDDRVRLQRELVERAAAGTVNAFDLPERPTPDPDASLEALLQASLDKVRSERATA